MQKIVPGAEPLLTPKEVAMLLRVDPKTVTRWANAGKLHAIKTAGGHRRYRATEVRAFYDAYVMYEEAKEAVTQVVYLQ